MADHADDNSQYYRVDLPLFFGQTAVSKAELAEQLAIIAKEAGERATLTIDNNKSAQDTNDEITSFLKAHPDGTILVSDEGMSPEIQENLLKLLNNTSAYIKPNVELSMNSAILQTSNFDQVLDAGTRRSMTTGMDEQLKARFASPIRLAPISGDALEKVLSLSFQKANIGNNIKIEDDVTYGALIEAVSSGAKLKDDASLRGLFTAANDGKTKEAMDMLDQNPTPPTSKPPLAPKA